MTHRVPASVATGSNRRFRIEVTQKDIERAERNNSYKCVVAQALARTIKDATRIEVDTQAIRFSRNSERLVYLTPYSVQGYVVAFDAGDPLQPFTFQLQSPVRVKRRPLTPKGHASNRAKIRARRRVRKAAVNAGLSPDTPEIQAQAAEAGKEAYHAAAALYPNEQAQTSEPGLRRIVPRVFKRKTRTYGSRMLRINQQ